MDILYKFKKYSYFATNLNVLYLLYCYKFITIAITLVLGRERIKYGSLTKSIICTVDSIVNLCYCAFCIVYRMIEWLKINDDNILRFQC